jgi:hypothetical protein
MLMMGTSPEIKSNISESDEERSSDEEKKERKSMDLSGS